MPIDFRQAALDRVTSPDHLDQLLTVTRPRGWIALGSAGVLLAAVGIWSLYGSLPREVPAHGILVHHDSELEVAFREVPSPGNGLILERLVETGDAVTQGQLLAKVLPVDQARLQEQLASTRHEIRSFEAQQKREATFAAEELRLQTETSAFEKTQLTAVLEREKRDLGALEARRDRLQKLVDDGVLARDTVLDAQAEIDQKGEQLTELEVRFRQIPLRVAQLRHQQDEERQTLALRLEQAHDREVQLTGQLADTSQITSPFSGRLVRWDVGPGDPVTLGRAVALIDGSDVTREPSLDAVMYVSAFEGKRITVGMPVQVSPSSVRREEHGFIWGEVVDVAPYAANSRSMLSELEDDQLVETILAEVGVPMRVWVRLHRDSDATSGFSWSAGEGPMLRITPGTPASGRVVVADRRPIELVVPAVKKLLGLD